MTSVLLDAAQGAREIDNLLDELVAAWNRAHTDVLTALSTGVCAEGGSAESAGRGRPDVASSRVLPFPAILPNASLAIEWRRMTWVRADLVSMQVGWTVRVYPGPAEGPAAQRDGVGSLAVAREGRGWAIAAADPARIRTAAPEGPASGRAGMLPRPGSGVLSQDVPQHQDTARAVHPAGDW